MCQDFNGQDFELIIFGIVSAVYIAICNFQFLGEPDNLTLTSTAFSKQDWGMAVKSEFLRSACGLINCKNFVRCCNRKLKTFSNFMYL